MTTPAQIAAVMAELEWLKNNPAFEQRPASMEAFLKQDYLNIWDKVRPSIRKELITIFGEESSGEQMAAYQRAMITGAIGIGKTTIASIVIPYMVHWCLCLKDPQEFFGLLPGSRIAFMQMSTSESQAKEVLFGDIDARLIYSPWFKTHAIRDPSFKNQIRFQKDIWILPGDSAETTFEGYNILGGILDEADSHKVTPIKDYAQSGYDTIDARIASRFGQRGFLLIIGQMKKSVGFAKRTFDLFCADPKAHAVRMTIWESFGWDNYLKPDGTRDSFWYDVNRKMIVPTGAAVRAENSNLMEIPNLYLDQFKNNPEKSLRDLAGIPPAVGDPFISLVYKITEARDRWSESHDNLGSPVGMGLARPMIADWFQALDTLKRVTHVDLAYSAQGDALGFAMGHVPKIVERDGENKPYIVIDLVARMKASPGTEIFIQEIRHFIYALKYDYGFKIQKVTMDGFQSTDMLQQLRKRRFETEMVSIDKQLLPYHDLREAIYEDRIEFPPYITYINHGDTQQVEIIVKELTELVDDGKKIDHPPNGSKDCADAIAGVAYTLMGDRKYRRKTIDMSSPGNEMTIPVAGAGYSGQQGFTMPSLSAPVPPANATSTWGLR